MQNRKTNTTASHSETAAQKDHYVLRQILPEVNKIKSLLLGYDFFLKVLWDWKKNISEKKIRNLRLQCKAVEKEFDTKCGYFASLSLWSGYIWEN